MYPRFQDKFGFLTQRVAKGDDKFPRGLCVGQDKCLTGHLIYWVNRVVAAVQMDRDLSAYEYQNW